MKSIMLLAGLLAGGVGMGLAQAVEMEGLYDGEVPVKRQDAEERALAVPQALMQVLGKLTGDAGVAQRPGMAATLKRADAMVQQFQYRPLPPFGYQSWRDQGYTGLLRVQFAPVAVAEMLRQAKVDAWGKSRPSVLIWLALDEGMGRYLVTEAANAEAYAFLGAETRRRGLPVLLPMADAEDQKQLTVDDVWNENVAAVLRASVRRYGPDVILIGHASRGANGVWQGRWAMINGGRIQSAWQSDNMALPAVLAAGVDGVTGRLARLAIDKANGEVADQLALRVANVRQLADYARVLKYLKSLPVVSTAAVSEVRGDDLILTLSVHGKREDLQQALTGSTTLLPLAGADSTPPLSYRLAP